MNSEKLTEQRLETIVSLVESNNATYTHMMSQVRRQNAIAEDIKQWYKEERELIRNVQERKAAEQSHQYFNARIIVCSTRAEMITRKGVSKEHKIKGVYLSLYYVRRPKDAVYIPRRKPYDPDKIVSTPKYAIPQQEDRLIRELVYQLNLHNQAQSNYALVMRTLFKTNKSMQDMIELDDAE